ncbi:MAG: hypothetical protein AB1633_12735 [Elusimicrobiota bacterium]
MTTEHLIVPIVGLFASVLTASLTYWYTKRSQLQVETRRLKEEYYRSFIKAFSDVAINNSDNEAQKRLSEGFNSLIVIGSPDVVKQLMRFHNFIRISNVEIPRDSAQWLMHHDELLKELIKAMRQDIYGKESNIDMYISDVHLVGKGPN